jgi:hypothetical protein
LATFVFPQTSKRTGVFPSTPSVNQFFLALEVPVKRRGLDFQVAAATGVEMIGRATFINPEGVGAAGGLAAR